MSQSDVHRQLVIDTARAIQQRHRAMHVTTDLLDVPGDAVPPLIGGYRPDIIARCTGACHQLVIAEAKTKGDIKNQHTQNQIDAFINHLDALTTGTGCFILAVNGNVARAKTVLRLNYRKRASSRLYIKLFDGLDFWNLDPLGDRLWHLC